MSNIFQKLLTIIKFYSTIDFIIILIFLSHIENIDIPVSQTWISSRRTISHLLNMNFPFLLFESFIGVFRSFLGQNHFFLVIYRCLSKKRWNGNSKVILEAFSTRRMHTFRDSNHNLDIEFDYFTLGPSGSGPVEHFR